MRRWTPPFAPVAALLIYVASAGIYAASAGETAAATTAVKRDPRAEVFATETAFAQSMADRDYKMFGTFIADEAIFFGASGPLRGRAAVLSAWKRFFDGPTPPFSWRPEAVEVLTSGTLAHSSGPVTAANGKSYGVFNSIWRLEADGRWRVVFDKGCDVCDTTRAE